MTNLAITGNAQAYINSSTVDGQFTKSSSGYVEVDDCELQVTGNVLISGSGTTTIIGNKINNLVVNNAGAAVLVKGANDCVMPQVTAGSLNIVDSIIRASSNTANAVTASAGTVVTLMNNQIVTPAADNVARVSIAGFHSIISLVYDKANSTLSNSLNSVVYFQTANVDSLVSSGNITGGNMLTAGLISATSTITSTANVTGGNITTAGLITATGNITGGNVLTGGLISATGNITGGNVLGGANVNATTHTGATVSVTGNITGSFFIGNGSQLTGIVSSYGNANVAANLAAFGSNPISTTGNVTAGNFIGGGAGTPTLSSATNLDLSAASSVRVVGGGTFRLPSLTTAQIANIIAANGDMIYNSSVNKFQGYENGAWANII
jgi:hypothetical protein